MQKYPLIVIGAGAAGLVVAKGAAQAGKKVLIIEKGHWGGDCTNFGCIPSKALIASSHVAQAITHAHALGIALASPQFSAQGALERVRSIVTEIRSQEDREALRKSGVEALEGNAAFVDSHTLLITHGGQTLTVWGEQIVIATGSHPIIPPIPGLQETPFLTNETLFSLPEIPQRLAILGAGPIGCELAQAMHRLGSAVTLIEAAAPLAREEPETQNAVIDLFTQQGIALYIGYLAQHIQYKEKVFSLSLRHTSSEKTVEIAAEALLIASGRAPNLSSLDLPNAGVLFSEQGIVTDPFGRTNQPHIWAIGDVAGPPFFTHAAENQARAVLTSLLLPWGFKKRLHRQPLPRVTYTDPEIASIGMSEREALLHYSPRAIAVYTVPLAGVDRAITTGKTAGFVKVITKKWSSTILGATIVAPRAGEMLMEIATAMYAKIPLRKLSHLIHPYPIYNLAIRRASDLWLTQTLLPSLKKYLPRSR